MEDIDIFKILGALEIPFEKQEHPPIFSEKDAEKIQICLDGIDVKNLFLKDKNSNYALVSMDLHQKADLKKIAAHLGFSRLSFCSADELLDILNITPGSVSPLCIMADKKNCVRVLFDKNFCGKKVIIHPLRNTASISLSFDDLLRFVKYFNHKYQLGEFYKDETAV